MSGYKRNYGLEETVPYQLFARSQQKEKLANKSNKNTDHHKIFLQSSIVSQAKGSAYVEIGNTKVIVSVFDPREIPNKVDYALKGEVSCEFKYAPFSCPKRKFNQFNNKEKHYSSMMKKALESAICLHELPNFLVDIHAMVLEEDGSALSGAIIGAGLALAEAGVPMYDLITSVTMNIVPKKDQNEANQNEEDEMHSLLVVSKLHTHKQICQIYQNGCISSDKLKEYIKALSKSCDDIVPIVQKCLLKAVMSNIKS
ncbi:exosome complex component MTR3 [Anthonomus grandis grandis]|uniref:exosome complex component MTR3 n=1 Tax=Anthonomus grandis grandis TaxID=2921223 RepID=UPI0021667464|nr:exosome complex component MTR3 [Anthonomus grandis grandis]